MKQLAQGNLLAGRVLSSPADSVAITCICSAKVSSGKLQRNISGLINTKSAPHFLDHCVVMTRTIKTIKGVFSAPHSHPTICRLNPLAKHYTFSLEHLEDSR